MIYCLNCGKGIPDESKFCTFCGTATPQVDPQRPNIAPPPLVQHSSHVNTTSAANTIHATHIKPATTSIPFYKNPGFYGALLIIASIFLPWVTTSGWILDMEGYNLLNLFSLGFDTSTSGDSDLNTGIIIWEIALGIIMFCALILLIDSFANFLSRGLAKFLKLLPFIITVLMLLLLFIGLKDKLDSDQFVDKLQTVGIGIIVILVGVILLLFYKKPRKVNRV